MKNIGIIGSGRLAKALALALRREGHLITILYRNHGIDSGLNDVQQCSLATYEKWESLDLCILAAHLHLEPGDSPETRSDLAWFKQIPAHSHVISVMANLRRPQISAFLAGQALEHMLCTPAVSLPGAMAIVLEEAGRSPLGPELLPSLNWVISDANHFEQHGLIMIGAAMAARAMGHVQRLLPASFNFERGYLYQAALSDAQRLMALTDNSGQPAYELVATPGGITERIAGLIFVANQA
jgi:hypothetical protein